MLKHLISLIALATMLAFTYAEAAWIGIEIRDKRSDDGKLQGIEVVDVDQRGPAAQAGLRKGDVIVFVDGRIAGSTESFVKMAADAPKGQLLHVTVLRNGERVNHKITLAETPKWLTYVRKGREQAAKQNFDEAERSFTKSIEIDPGIEEAYFGRAGVYMNKKQYDAAIADYTKYIERRPSSWDGYGNRGMAYERKGQRDDAIRDYTKAIDLKPNAPYSAKIRCDRGHLFYEQGAYDRAIEDFNNALKIDPKYTPAYEMRGNAYAKKKDWSRAKADHETAAKLYLDQGVQLAKKGNHDGAIRFFGMGIRLDTSHTASLYYNRGLVQEQKGDYQRSVADYTAAIQKNPSYTDAYRRRGTLYAEKMGDKAKANHDWEKATSLESAGTGSRATTGLVCPSPIFGKLLWSGNTPRCLEGFALIPGWRFKQESTPWVCAKCTPNCIFVEEPDRTYICASTSAGGRAASRSGGDSLLGETWDPSDKKSKGVTGGMEGAPRSESEVRQALENMGFRVVQPGTIGAFDGYWIEIADPAKTARFGFSERRQARATAKGQETTSTIGCWTERKGEQFIIWIDGRDVSIRDESKLPPWVKLYSK